MPRQRVRARVVFAESAGALQIALDQALAEEQMDRNWHVAEVSLATVISDAARVSDLPGAPYVALISLRKQEWFFTDFLRGLIDAVRRKPSSPDDAAGS